MIYTIIYVFLKDCEKLQLHYLLGTDCQIYHQRRMRQQQLVIFPQIFLSSSFLPSGDKSMKNVLSLTFHICFSKGRGSREEDDMWSKKRLENASATFLYTKYSIPLLLEQERSILFFKSIMNRILYTSQLHLNSQKYWSTQHLTKTIFYYMMREREANLTENIFLNNIQFPDPLI